MPVIHACGMRPGLYAVVTEAFVAGFVIDERGHVSMCAPILRKGITHWLRVARWIAP